MKKQILRSKLTAAVAAAAMISLAVASCVYIDSVNIYQVYDGKEVAYAYAGDMVTFTIDGHIEAASDVSSTQFVAAILVPKSWQVANNAKVTYTCTLADDRDAEMSMSVMPSSSLPKNGNGLTWSECLNQTYGVGTNVLDDMEWVVFQTDQTWNIGNGERPTYKIIFRLPVGEDNLKCHLGFFVNHTDDGFSGGTDHKKVFYSNECFEVVGGKGATIDFCSNHFNNVSPMSSLQDDYITFSFIGGVEDNQLVDAGEIYFEGIAVGASGATYTVNEKTSKTLMKRLDEKSGTYYLTLWPMGFFNVPDGEELVSIRYFFTNADRSVIIGQSDDDEVMLGAAHKDEHEPFVFQFQCQ